MSFFEAKFTFAETSPVAGLNTSEVLFEVPEKEQDSNAKKVAYSSAGVVGTSQGA